MPLVFLMNLFYLFIFGCLQLPDYHEIIAKPMDFATIRGKLSGGAYANLEQFEVIDEAICSVSAAFKYRSSCFLISFIVGMHLLCCCVCLS